VALLGEFTDSPRFGGDPKAAAVGSLEDLLAELATRHGLDPTAKVTYVNPVSGDSRYVDTIGGHRDYTATECPGERLYDLLPSIRENVKAKMGSAGDSPADGSTVAGSTLVTATATDDVGVTQVEFTVDGVSLGVDDISSDGWTYSWDTTSHSDGSHTVGAVAVDSGGQTAGHTVTVTVDNVADAPAPTMHVGDLEGTATTLKNGWRALVTTTVLTDSQPLEGAEVQGSWSTGGTATCTTDAFGACTVTSGSMRKAVSSVTFSIEALLLDGYAYDPTANVDADQDSTGTAITVTRP
jgi:hypothetical protein